MHASGSRDVQWEEDWVRNATTMVTVWGHEIAHSFLSAPLLERSGVFCFRSLTSWLFFDTHARCFATVFPSILARNVDLSQLKQGAIS